ncbi:MAG TPA: Uma2 family endonuclease [Vicinamibacterales bacterium]|nr:Uma2 family endonuclease [Vicinamibacterales bacterium]
MDQYLDGEETNRRRELIFGVVRQPPAPFPYHQRTITRLAARLEDHTLQDNRAVVYVSPIDVVLDEVLSLVLQPDIIVVTGSNRSIVSDRVRGAPDLVVEVLSASTRRHDSTVKRHWYRQYGVREYWLVDPADHRIEVVTCGSDTSATYTATEHLQSAVLPGFTPIVGELFDER